MSKDRVPPRMEIAQFVPSWLILLTHHGLLITMVFVVSVMAIQLSMEMAYPEGYVDPFTPYEAIMPGKPTEMLVDYPCAVPDLPLNFSPRPVCVLSPDEGLITHITVIAADETITQLIIAADGLQLLDVVQRWGQPDAQQETKRGIAVRWLAGVYAIAKPVPYLHNRSRINSLVISCKQSSTDPHC